MNDIVEASQHIRQYQLPTVSEQIILVEPWFEKVGHIPFNRAFLAIVRDAFPSAHIAYACTQEYFHELQTNQNRYDLIDHWISANAWTQSSVNGDISEFWRRLKWLTKVCYRIRSNGFAPTHLIVLGASGPIVFASYLAKTLVLPSRCKVFVVLHAAPDLFSEWRPLNPFRRLFFLNTAIRFSRLTAVHVIALENHIASAIRRAFPGQAKSIRCIPHGFDEAETLPEVQTPREGSTSLRLLFLGQATLPKGFGEFVRLAQLSRERGLVQIEFRAAGALRRDTRSIDQSPLTKRTSEFPLSRHELLDELSRADLVFSWTSEDYNFTPSGILLDCIALGVPICGRRSLAITAIEADVGACGLFADDLEALLSALIEMLDEELRQRRMETWKENLRKARFERNVSNLGAVAFRELN